MIQTVSEARFLHDKARADARAVAQRIGAEAFRQSVADIRAANTVQAGPVRPGDTFIDWVCMAQRWPAEMNLPLVGEGVRLKGKALDTIGELDGKRLALVELGDDGSYSIPSRQHRGSFSTSLLLRCDGLNVEVSGNPGRFGRADNIWNYDLDGSVSKVNSIVNEYALPAFTPGVCRAKDRVAERDARLGLFEEWTGAIFRELHATRNYASGNDAMSREVLRAFQGKRASRLSKGSFGEETVVFGDLKKAGTSKVIVCYRKAEEMLAHAGKGRGINGKALSAAEREEAKDRIKHSQEYQFARDTGLVRIELKMGRVFLRDNGLRFLGGASMAKIISIFDRETGFLLDASPDQSARLVSDLPRNLRLPALAWIRGEDVKLHLSRATFYRIRKQLMDRLSLDISEPRNTNGRPNAEEALQRHIDALPSFDLRTLSAPEWYGLPEIRRAA